MDGKSKQMGFESEKHSADLDHLGAKLTATFLDLLDGKQAVNLCVAVNVLYTHTRKELTKLDMIVLHIGRSIGPSRLALLPQHHTLQATSPDRHTTFNSNLSVLLLAEILKRDLQGAEYTTGAALMFRQLSTFLAKKPASLNGQNVDNRCFGYAD